MSQAHMVGARLAFVVVPLEGEVTRKINTWTKKAGLGEKYVEQPAGCLVYFPRGHVLRIRDRAQLRLYKLDKPAKIINLEGLNDPNSPIGKMMMSQDEATRRGAFQSLEEQVIRLAEAKSGKVEVTKDPRLLATHEEPVED
mgnify:FL=1